MLLGLKASHLTEQTLKAQLVATARRITTVRSVKTVRQIDAGGLRQHVVTGGDGPPLLLLHAWPQTWYAWRLVMPGLARHFSVVVPDQRGCGLSGKPEGGYDTGTLAADLVALMDALGHEQFVVAGHDTGMWIGYALAADHPGWVARLAVAETPLPGVSPSPPLFASAHLNNALWHFAFNRLAEVNDQLVAGREDVYFRVAVRDQKPHGHCPATPSGITSTLSPPAPTRCTPASRSTAR
jgi:pimeloyl-ACP methyl ester carboxylesterase